MHSSRDPLWWSLFGAGGVMAAFCIPVLLLVHGLLIPLGVMDGLPYAEVHALMQHPVVRIFIFTLIMLSMYHWAHRFRFTLYDGLQLKHLEALIMVACYGTATAVSLVAAFVLFIQL